MNKLEKAGFKDAIRIGNLTIVERRSNWSDFLARYLAWREQLATLPEGRSRNRDAEDGFFNAVIRNRLTEADHMAEVFNLSAAEVDKSVNAALSRLLGWGQYPRPNQAVQLRDHFHIPAADFQRAVESSLKSNVTEPKKFETLVTGLQVDRATIVKAVIAKALDYITQNYDLSLRNHDLNLLLNEHKLTAAELTPLADQIVRYYFQVLEQGSYISGKPIDDLEALIKDFSFIRPTFVAAAKLKVQTFCQGPYAPEAFSWVVIERLRKIG